MIIDAHHHLWEYKQMEYAWINDAMYILKRDYLPGDLEQELSHAAVSGTVVVQARQSLEETRWLLELAGQHSFIKGVVGWLDLRSSELDQQLKAYTSHPKLVGLRHVLQDEPDDEFMLRKDFMNGIAQLEAYDLTYDLLLFPRHIEPAIQLVDHNPRQRFVLDHLGKPLIKAGIMEPWKKDISKLAGYSNVWCKLSGMVTEADLQNWSYKELLPYMETVLEAFGPERIMLGSDWPVCRLAGEYSEVIGLVRKFIESMNSMDQTKILYQNAIDCYQLKLNDNGEEKA